MHAVRAGAQAAVAAVGKLHHVVAQHIAAAVEEVVVVRFHPVDDAVIHLLCAVRVVDLFLIFVAVPDAAHESGCAAHVPHVVAVFRRTGLADLVKVVAAHHVCRGVCIRIRTVDRQVQKLIHNGRRIKRDCLLLAVILLVIVDHVAFVILNAVHGVRGVILAAVAENLVRAGHLAHGNTVRQTADGHAADVVGVFLRKRRDVQVLREELVTYKRRHLVDELCHRGVQRFRNGLIHIHRAGERTVKVVRTLAAVIKVVRQRLILQHGAVRDEIVLQRRRIHADGLNGRTRLVRGVRNVVLHAVAGLFQKLVVIVGLVRVHAEDSAVILHQAHAAPNAVVARKLLPVVFQVAFKRLLHRHIFGGVDLEAAVINEVDCHVAVEVCILHKQVNGVVEHLFLVPVPHLGGNTLGIGLLFFVVHFKVHAAQLQVCGLLHRLVVLRARDTPLVVHFGDDKLAALAVRLRVVEHAQRGRVLRRRGNGRTLRNVAVPNVLAEVAFCRGLHAVIAVAVVDKVQVCFENFILRILLFKVQRHEDFLHLTHDAHLIFARQVLDKLLRDGGAAGGIVAGRHAVYRA